MFCTFVLVLAFVSTTRPHPTSCAEDSHCSSGFFCEGHVCRECLRCGAMRREPPPSPPRDHCAKSLLDCGPCRKGLVQTYDGVMSGLCTPPAAEMPSGLLPLYGWAVIAASLLLMIVILCLFAKMKTFKIAYASRTSVQSLQTDLRPEFRVPPPPYNLPDHSPSSPHHEDSQNAFELQKLVESPQPPSREMQPPRENSSSQAARVWNAPVYQPPHGPSPTPELPVQVQDGAVTYNIVAATPDRNQAVTARTNNNAITSDGTCGKHGDSPSGSSSLGKRRIDQEVQDSNNNCSSEEEGSSSQQTKRSAPHCANMMSGPSFVINVVENINNAMPHAEFHT